MHTNITKNPLRTFLGSNREKNKNIKASPKKRSSYNKKSNGSMPSIMMRDGSTDKSVLCEGALSSPKLDSKTFIV